MLMHRHPETGPPHFFLFFKVGGFRCNVAPARNVITHHNQRSGARNCAVRQPTRVDEAFQRAAQLCIPRIAKRLAPQP